MTDDPADSSTPGDGATDGSARGGARYVIHLVVTSADLAAARALARELTRSLRFAPELSRTETTVSEESDQLVQHRVFCDRLLDAGRRCLLEADHPAACLAENPRRLIPSRRSI
nr:hypothetical protein [Micromonospora sp. DSM 115978]